MAKLQRILSLLSEEELKEFKKILGTHKGEVSGQLLICFDHYTKKTEQESGDAALSALLRPGKDHIQNYVDQIESKLLSRLLDYMVQRKLQKNQHELDLFLVEELNRRGDSDYIDYYLQRAAKGLAKQHDQCPESYLRAFSLEMERIKNQVSLGERNLQGALARAIMHLDQFYVLKRLQLGSAGNGMARIVGGSDELNLWQAADLRLVKNSLSHSLLFQSLSLAEAMQRNSESDEEYQALLPLVLENWENFDHAIAQELCRHLLNHCTRRLRVGIEGFREDYRKLSSKLLAEEMKHGGGQMKPGFLKNVIEAAMHIQDAYFAKMVLKDYINCVHARLRVPVLQYNLGVIAFHEGHYKEACGCFHFACNLSVKVDIFYEIDSMLYLIWTRRILVDLDNIESLVHKTRTFISRARNLPDTTRTGYQDLLKCINRIYRFQRKKRSRIDAIQDFRSSILANPILPKKGLLIEHLKRWTGLD